MRKVSVRQAREKLGDLLDGAERGESVIIQRRGRPVARLVPETRAPAAVPDLKAFRAGIRVKGKAASRQIVAQRERERY